MCEETLNMLKKTFPGAKDVFIPMEEVRKVKTRLKELGQQAEVEVYPGADL